MSGSTVQIDVEGGRLPAHLAVPETPNGAAVVVLQEIFGVNANIRGIADGYAARGYVALAPDLFWRQQSGVDFDPSDPASRDLAMGLMKAFDAGTAVKDAQAAAGFLRGRLEVSGGVGVVGYCLGGKLAYLLSTGPGVDAAVSYYGTGIHAELDRAAGVRCPLLLHIGQADPLCPPQAQAAIRDALGRASQVTIAEYAGAGHAFARRGAPTCDEAAADRADALTARFFGEHLARAS